ncbi:MAG: Trm112 family protein [Kofleriaceae bacterium]
MDRVSDARSRPLASLLCYASRVLAPELVALLVCPTSKQPLVYFPRGEADQNEAEAFLLCPAAKLRYRLERGVPVLLAEEAETVDPTALSRLLARAKQLGIKVPD